MKKLVSLFILSIIIICCIISCVNNKLPSEKATQYFENKVLKTLLKHGFISFKITRYCVEDSITFEQKFWADYNKKYRISQSDEYSYLYYGNDTLKVIDGITDELTAVVKDNVDFYRGMKMELTKNIQGLEFLLTPYYKELTALPFIDIQDSIIQKTPYKILSYTGFDLLDILFKPAIDTFLIKLYINDKSGLPEKAVRTRLHPELFENESKTYIYTFSDLSLENKDSEVQVFMDFNQPKYTNYERYDNKNYPHAWYTPDADSVMSNSILSYPIVSLNGETTCIAKQNGWVLLDFWSSNCRSCKEWLAKLKKEKDSLGTTFFEKNNIKIMAINPLSGNIERLGKEVSEYNAINLTYHAKGINKLLLMPIMPQYYLISPNKQIVYKHTGIIEDYSEILNIINNYKPTNSNIK